MNINIINTHSHINMLKEIPIELAIKELEEENIVALVPSSGTEDIYM